MSRAAGGARATLRALCRLGVVFAAVLVSFTAEPAAAAPTAPIDVVGGPVAAEGAAVVIAVDSAHDLRLEGVSPDTGRVVWSRAYSESAINPGLAPTLYVVDNVVVDLAPVGGAAQPLVDVVGVNATTGATAWKGPQDILVSDVPSPCGQSHYFCVIGYTSNSSTAMAVVNPATGTGVGEVDGLVDAVDLDLYQTDAKTPTLEALSPGATVLWTRTFNQLFDGPGYDPRLGWDFTSFGSTEVGTAGATDSDHSNGLDDAKTIGFSLADGHTEWTLPGQFQCGGTLEFMSPAFDCLFSGTAAQTHPRSIPVSYRGLHLRLQGVETATGTVSWTQPVADVNALANGDAAFSDDSHLLVQLQNGARVLLDTATGKTAPPPPHEILWCSASGLFKVDENKDLNPDGQRADSTHYYPCTASGRPTAALPSSTPSNVGVTVDGVFLWASPHGLSRHQVGSAQGIA